MRKKPRHIDKPGKVAMLEYVKFQGVKIAQ
jgi:hypothetical protein